MPLPQTICPRVSPATIDKVGRLFNGGIDDILHELLQNARRARATRVAIETRDRDGRSALLVRDDGQGIDDPAMLLTLGASDWGGDTRDREDPAGMGVFSMAGLRVEYRSFSARNAQGWRVVIAPDAWTGHHRLAVEPFDIDAGTEVLIDMPEPWAHRVERAIDAAALCYPLPVTFDGAERVRRNWLADALCAEHWRGSRIGVFCDLAHGAGDRTLNFHGVTVSLALPLVREVGRGRHWVVRVDIGDTPELQLVLPARKEVVQTPFVGALRNACEAAIYRAIAAGGAHRLSFADFAGGARSARRSPRRILYSTPGAPTSRQAMAPIAVPKPARE